MTETEDALSSLYQIMEHDAHKAMDYVMSDNQEALKALHALYRSKHDKIIDLLDEWPEKEILNDYDDMLAFARWKWFVMDMQDFIDYMDGNAREQPF